MGGETTWKRRSPPGFRQGRRVLRVVHSADVRAVGRTLELDGTEHVLGREASGAGRIEDPHVSRAHARVVKDASPLGYAIEDLGGSNGTFLDGARVAGTRAIGASSVLSLGETLLVVDAEPDADDLPARPDASEDEATELTGGSFASRRLRKCAASAARDRGAVLLLGDSGSGKEVLARAIHRLSGLEPFVAVNCAAIAPELAESQLFGHKKGAFTGADRDREGLFQRARGGTLFLDELGELPVAVQAKLLRVLEEGTVEAVGGERSERADVRVIAATNADVSASTFRRDLFARLSDWVFRIPPLAERRADVLELFRIFAGKDVHLAVEAAEALLLHAWPLNVRELQKLAQRITKTASTADIELPDLPRDLAAPLLARATEEDATRAPPSVAELELALRAAKGNVKLAAQARGWHRTQLYRWLERAGVDPARFR